MPDFRTMEAAFDALRQGKMVIVTDDMSDDSEGNLVMAAESINARDVNFMSREGGGLIAVAGHPSASPNSISNTAGCR